MFPLTLTTRGVGRFDPTATCTRAQIAEIGRAHV